MENIRVLVVDDEGVVREGIAAILSLQPDLEVVGQAVNGAQAVELAKKTQPDVVLLDLSMPVQNGLETIPILQEILPEVRILVLTSFAESDQVYEALKAGALGFMLKDARKEQLIKAIHDTADGQASIDPVTAVRVIQEVDRPSESEKTTCPLTPREMDALRLIARGMTNQEIADDLSVAERTVAKYVSSILEKLQLANRTQAALYAIRKGWTDEDEKKRK